MNTEKFEVKTRKLNLIHFPECNEKRFILLKINSNIDILLPEKNEQKIILTYNIKSNELPFDIMWECGIKLTFDEELEEWEHRKRLETSNMRAASTERNSRIKTRVSSRHKFKE